MKLLFTLLLAIVLLITCAAASILLARGWFTLRTTTTTPPSAPTIEVFAPDGGAPTPTLAAVLPTVPSGPIGGDTTSDPGRFTGTFSGTLTTDNGSSAPATLTLTQNGDAVAARLDIGQGLTLDAGNCGAQAVPSGGQSVAGAVDPADPMLVRATGSIPVAGFTIGVALTAGLAADGRTLDARADLDLPLLCGRDPAISGTFVRQ